MQFFSAFSFLPKADLIFLADRCIDIGVDYRSFEGLRKEDIKEWDFVYLWLKFKTMEKANLLVSNAIQATSPQLGEVKVRVSLIADSEVEVAITDNGPGIPDSLQNQIFQPFFTTKDQGEGFGLGLSVSKEIIKNQNGRIQFESLPGKTTFSVILPVAE